MMILIGVGRSLKGGRGSFPRTTYRSRNAGGPAINGWINHQCALYCMITLCMYMPTDNVGHGYKFQ